VIGVDLDTVRLFLHVLAATVWVGGQAVLVAISGGSAYLHARAGSRREIAFYGAVTGVSAIATLFVGLMLAG
jgi:uncharacterized membrane protein